MRPNSSGRLRAGVRSLQLFIFVSLLLPGAAQAQFILGASKDAPSVRIASGDRFEDALSTFREQSKERNKERLPQIERQLQLIEEGQTDSTLERQAGGAATLKKQLNRERGLLLSTADLAEQIWELSHLPAHIPSEPTLGEWMDEERHLDRLRQEEARSNEVEEARREILRGEEGDIGFNWLLTKAEIDHRTASALWLRALIRQSEARLSLFRERVVVTPADLKHSQEALKEDLPEIKARFGAEAHAILTLQPSKTATTAAFLRAWAGRAAATLRVDAIRAMLKEQVPVSSDLRQRLQWALSAVENREAEWGRRLFQPSLKSRAKRRLATLKEAAADLQTCEHYLALIQPPPMWWQQPRFVQRVTVSVIIGSIALLLILFGGYIVRRLNRLADSLTGLAGLSIQGQMLKWLGTAIMLVWPLAILSVVAPLILWRVWDSKIRLLQAIRLVDQPLFFLDTTAVSVFSIVKLGFAFWAAVVLSKVMRDLLAERIYPRLGWDSGLTNAMSTLVHYVTLLIGGVIGLRFVGVGMSSWAIFAGVLGIGIGFGLRNVTENFIAGVILLVERPIKIGDWVEVAGLEGEVRQIRARSTVLLSRDNIAVIIPNSMLVSAQVTNWSHGDPKVRISISVGVAYGSDTSLCRKTLSEVVQRHGQVLKRPAPEVFFTDFGASTLDFVVSFWIQEQHSRFRLASDLRFAIDAAFRAKGLEIAFSQLDVHLRTPDGLRIERQVVDPTRDT